MVALEGESVSFARMSITGMLSRPFALVLCGELVMIVRADVDEVCGRISAKCHHGRL